MGMHYKCLTHTSNLFYLWQNLRNEGLMVCLLYSNIIITKEIASKKMAFLCFRYIRRYQKYFVGNEYMNLENVKSADIVRYFL